MLIRIQEWAKSLKRETLAIYLAYRDPRVPWHARLLAACVVAYAFSPIDLIPDFVPILGYLDDLLLVPIGILLARRMIPDEIMAECRTQAALLAEKPISRAGAAAIMLVWLIAALSCWWLARRWFA